MASEHQRIDVLGVHVSAIDLDEGVRTITGWIEDRRREYVCVTTVNNVVECQDDPVLLEIHNRAGLTTPDGMPLVWACHWAGARHVQRVYGPDLLLAMSEHAAGRGIRFFFYGGHPGVPEQLAEELGTRYPGLRVCGTYSPPFRPLDADEDDRICRMIDDAQPDIVWVGLGNPKQERWMAEHRPKLQAPVLIGVGAAFDIFAGRTRQAPRWMQRRGLEWLFRLCIEPRRLWRRYLVNNPRFVLGILRRPPRPVDADGAVAPRSSLVAKVRWRVLKVADRAGLDVVSTVRSGPGAGLRLGSRNASADYRSGANERPVQEAVAGHLRPGSVFLDVGANVGFFALLASRIVGPSGAVAAIEPMPENVTAMRANLRRNGTPDVTIVEAAASDHPGRGRLGLSAHAGGNALEESGAPPDVTGFVEVDLVTVDDLVAAGRVRPPDLVKIDTESGELEVLRGMQTTLATHRPAVLLELDAATAAEVEQKAAPIEELLRASGYTVRRLAPSYPNRHWHVAHLWAEPVTVAG